MAPIRVLLIDDEPMMRRALRRLLSRKHAVVESDSAVDALAMVTAGETFDVILCDLSMPDRSGVEVRDALKAWAPALAERLIFVTGEDPSEVARLLGALPNPVLRKPFAAAALRDTIASVLARSTAARRPSLRPTGLAEASC
jgi:CheY-like chemotaxis protein